MFLSCVILGTIFFDMYKKEIIDRTDLFAGIGSVIFFMVGMIVVIQI